ncbi:MAG: acyltransferase [Fibrobacterales bacterium]
MKSSGSNRLLEFDILRALLIICVVAIHSMASYHGKWGVALEPSSIMKVVDTWLSGFTMHLFFVVSGYFAGYSIKKYSASKNMLLRFKRLLVPSFIGMATYQLISMLFVFATENEGSFFESIQLFHWKYYLFFGGWIGHLWYVNVLFLYYLLFVFIKRKENLFSRISRYQNLFYVMTIALFLIVVAFFLSKLYKEFVPYNYLFSFVSPTNLMKYLPFFFLGMVFENNQKLFQRNTSNKIVLMSFCIYTTFVFGESILRTKSVVFQSIFDYSYEGVYSVFALAMVYPILSLARYIKMNGVIEILSKDSFAIYLFHHPIIYIMTWWFKKIGFVDWRGALVLFVCALILSILLKKMIFTRFKVLRYVIGEV